MEYHPKQQNESDVDHFFVGTALQESAAFFLAVQQVIDDIRVNFHSHIERVLALKWSGSNIADSDRRGSDQYDFVAESVGWQSSAHDVPHRILRVGAVGTGVVDEGATVEDMIDDVRSQLNVIQAIG